MRLLAEPTPSSARISTPSAWARACKRAVPTLNRIAAANRSVVRARRGIGRGPTPSARTLWAQNGWSTKNGTVIELAQGTAYADAFVNGWSAKNGTVIEGTPARSPAAVVPAPP